MGEFGMVIVGAGQAGGRAALTLRDQGHDGRIVLLAAEPSPPYERPPLSKAYLTGERAADDFTFAKAAALEAAGIEFRPACVVEAIERRSRTVRLRGGERVCYAKLLLATGRAPRRLPLEGAVAERVLYLRDLSDADRLRQALRPGARIAIVGGGFIGLEVAASASALGCRPLVIELLPRLLSRMVPAPIAAFLRRRAVVLVGPVRADGERALGVGVLPAFQPHQPRRHGVREGADVARGEHGGSAVASVASTTMPLSTARPAASASPVRGTAPMPTRLAQSMFSRSTVSVPGARALQRPRAAPTNALPLAPRS